MMKRYSLLILIFFLVACSYQHSNSEWNRMAAPLASSIRDFAEVDNKTLFIATTSGIFKSNNGGKNWQPSGLQGTVIDKIITTKNGTLLAGTYRSGLYRSDNLGDTWTLVGFKENVYIYSILESKHGEIFLAASYISEGSSNKTPTGVFMSSNDGKTWQQTSLRKNDIISLNEPKQDLLISSSKSGTFISSDNGKNWALGGRGLPNTNPISGIISFKNILYASIGDRQDESGILRGGVFRSEDDGYTWFPSDVGIDKKSPISSICLRDSIFYVSAGFEQENGFVGIYRSFDKGKTWSKYALNGKLTRFISTTSDNKLIVGTNGSSLYMENDAKQLTQYGLGINNWETFRVAISKSNIYATGSGIWSYSQTDKHWSLIRNSNSIDLAVTANGRLLIFEHNHILYSSNKGKSWQNSANISGDFAIFKVINDKLIIANISNNGSWYSTDQGLTWLKYKLPILGPISMRTAIQTENGTIILSGASKSPLTFRLRKKQNKFEKVVALDTIEVWDFAVQKGVIFAGTYANGIFKSTDDGITWKPSNTGLKNNNEYLTVTSITIVNSKTLVCTTLGKGIFISKDKGNSWIKYNNGLLDKNFWTSAYDSTQNIIFSASPSGIFQKQI